jgi:hypothetical protein
MMRPVLERYQGPSYRATKCSVKNNAVRNSIGSISGDDEVAARCQGTAVLYVTAGKRARREI